MWPGSDSYDPNASPTPTDGHHNAGLNCMSACHNATNTVGAPVWLFGGTVWQSDGITAAAHVEVLVTDGTNTYTTYSADNGNFWVPATAGTINFAASSVLAFVRNSNGVRQMPTPPTIPQTPKAGCNGCHSGTVFPRIVQP